MFARVVLSIALLVNVSVTRADMERAAALARWPHTAADRVRFHDPYLFLTIDPRQPVTLDTRVLQIEVVTEFRRMELIAEEHEKLGDSFGRGGSDELVGALRPWRGRLAIDVHLQLPSCGRSVVALSARGCVPAIPATDVVIDGVGAARATPARRSVLYARTGLNAAALGNMAEATFDAHAADKSAREVRVIVDGRELARTFVDFVALE